MIRPHHRPARPAPRRLRARPTLAVLAVLAVTALAAPPPAAADDRPGGDANAAIAVNQTDGATVVRTALSLRKVKDGVVDQTNEAYALASCTSCTTVAVAMQVVLVQGPAEVVQPVNRAVAVNDRCTECLTYASATQVVLTVDGPVRLTSTGRQRLNALAKSLRELDERVPGLTAAQLHGEVSASKAELLAIFSDELIVKTDQQDRTEAEDPLTTVAPAGGDSPNAAARGLPATAPSSTETVAGRAGRGAAVTSTATVPAR